MRTFTALYDNRNDAETAQTQLRELGVLEADRLGLHDGENPGAAWASTHGVLPPEDDRRLYEESLKRGGFLLTVNVEDEYAERVHDLLESSPAVDVDERERQYREAGYMAAPAPTPPIPPAEVPLTRLDQDSPTHLIDSPTLDASGESIPIVQEQLRVGKRETERGAVRLRSYVVEQPVHEEVSLREEHVQIERRPVNQPVTDAEALLQERTLELTETAEEAVISKEAFVREEVSLRKDVTERTETIEDTVRHTEVDVENADGRPRT
jgi:uncharacterized protein (TIGR02271 family)